MTTSPTPTRDEQIAKALPCLHLPGCGWNDDLKVRQHNEKCPGHYRPSAAQLFAEQETQLQRRLDMRATAQIHAEDVANNANAEIVRLQAENERLRAALMDFATMALTSTDDDPAFRKAYAGVAEYVRRKASQALAPAPVGEGRPGRFSKLAHEPIAELPEGYSAPLDGRSMDVLIADEAARLSAPIVPARDAVLEGYNKDWRALYKAIDLPEDTTDAKVISDRIMEIRASAGLAVELAEYLFLTDCSDFDRYQWLKAECVRRCPVFFSLVGEDLLLNPARGGDRG